jgi:hypothetical protein
MLPVGIPDLYRKRMVRKCNIGDCFMETNAG